MDVYNEAIRSSDLQELRAMRSLINTELSLRFKEDFEDSHVPVCDDGHCPCTFKLPYGVRANNLDLSELKFNNCELVVFGLWEDDDKNELRRELIGCLGPENRSESIYIRLDMKKAFLKFHNHETAASAQAALIHNGDFKVNFSATADTVKLLRKK